MCTQENENRFHVFGIRTIGFSAHYTSNSSANYKHSMSVMKTFNILLFFFSNILTFMSEVYTRVNFIDTGSTSFYFLFKFMPPV
ncbi:hypothetical protein RN001_011193 [Aquatica leii]|uniref:Uncharacterized protein n=1 Tax=Aquatica leii TaxID=1421715 RepID=A0AAN7SEW6_9COLE|nr:hypothetical protein RN001_011193 [Aquatica leii]